METKKTVSGVFTWLWDTFRAKGMGSGAVLVAFLLWGYVWLELLRD